MSFLKVDHRTHQHKANGVCTLRAAQMTQQPQTATGRKMLGWYDQRGGVKFFGTGREMFAAAILAIEDEAAAESKPDPGVEGDALLRKAYDFIMEQPLRYRTPPESGTLLHRIDQYLNGTPPDPGIKEGWG